MEWMAVQRRFVDNPYVAVDWAQGLVNRALAARGYPDCHFEQRAADISVSYPGLLKDYRAAHEIVARQADIHVATEELRRAMVSYRSLFWELLEPTKVQGIE